MRLLSGWCADSGVVRVCMLIGIACGVVRVCMLIGIACGVVRVCMLIGIACGVVSWSQVLLLAYCYGNKVRCQENYSWGARAQKGLRDIYNYIIMLWSSLNAYCKLDVQTTPTS